MAPKDLDTAIEPVLTLAAPDFFRWVAANCPTLAEEVLKTAQELERLEAVDDDSS